MNLPLPTTIWQGSPLYLQGSDTLIQDNLQSKQYVYHLIDKMKNTINHFFLNVDFNKLEKVHFYKQQDDPSGMF
jgi:hypothetical protein